MCKSRGCLGETRDRKSIIVILLKRKMASILRKDFLLMNRNDKIQQQQQQKQPSNNNMGFKETIKHIICLQFLFFYILLRLTFYQDNTYREKKNKEMLPFLN